MKIFNDVQFLKDQVLAIEKELSRSVNEVKTEATRNFKILVGLIALESVPTLQALGIPTRDILPSFAKYFIGFIHGIAL